MGQSFAFFVSRRYLAYVYRVRDKIVSHCFNSRAFGHHLCMCIDNINNTDFEYKYETPVVNSLT